MSLWTVSGIARKAGEMVAGPSRGSPRRPAVIRIVGEARRLALVAAFRAGRPWGPVWHSPVSRKQTS